MKNSPTRTMTAKRIAVAVAAVCATMSAPSFAAGGDMKALMDLLLKKGVITQQEYDQNIQAAQDAAENQAFKEKRLSDDVTKLNNIALKNKDTGQVMKNGFGIQSADGKYSAQFVGRVHMDYRNFDENGTVAQATSGFSSRRIRFGVKGKMTNDFDYFFHGDWSDGSTTATSQTRLDEGWFHYVGYKPLGIRVGKFKTPFALDKQTSSNNIDFMERALIVTDDKELIPGNQFGIMALGSPISGFNYAIAKHSGATGTESATHGDSDTTGRLSFNFAELMGNKDLVTHFGTAYSVGKVGSAAAAVAPATEGKGVSSFLSTNSASLQTGADRTRTGYEAAVAYGPFKLQGEHIAVNYDNRIGAATSQTNITGWHTQVMWNITGESHSYSNSSGTFGWIKPKQPFSTDNGGLGAWQVGMRYSTLASDAAISANSTTNYVVGTTFGLNWILNDYSRVMLNYVTTDFDHKVKAATGPTKEKAINMRYQLSF